MQAVGAGAAEDEDRNRHPPTATRAGGAEAAGRSPEVVRREIRKVLDREHDSGPGTSPPSSQKRLITDATNGSSGDRPPLSVVSGDTHTPDSHIVASSKLTGAVSVENGSVGSGELIQQSTQLVQTQTAMVAAQTRAMSTQRLPPVPTYSGEGEQSL